MADIATIKANIRKMLEQGAAEADVDRYVKLEGVTAEQLRADQSSRMGVMWPVRHDKDGMHLDWNAGLPGVMKRALTLPGEVVRGETDINTPEGFGRVMEMATAITPANPAMMAGSKAIPGVAQAMKSVPRRIPTQQELLKAGAAQMKSARIMGVDYKGSAVMKMVKEIQDDLVKEGFADVPAVAGDTHRILNTILNPPNPGPGGQVLFDITNLRALRKSLQKLAGNYGLLAGENRSAATRSLRKLDAFIEKADPASVLAGPASKAGKAWAEGRANYAAGKRSQTLTGKEWDADLRAAAANSGQNIGNSLRQKIAGLILKEKDVRGFSPIEKGMMERIVRGSKTANRTRNAGNYLGGGGGLGALMTSGAGAGVGYLSGAGPAGAVAGAMAGPVVGGALKQASAGMTRGALHNLDDIVRMRSPLYRGQPQMMTPANQAMQQAIMRMLMGTAVNAVNDEEGGR